ncbi:hypothetical protein HMPREF1595_04528 [Escherichia coli 907672]|nr:hypothetical protein HMPREF1595_04528 [Escherichia coli 907672]
MLSTTYYSDSSFSSVSDANEVVLIHDRFYNPAMIFLPHCQRVKA